jgi:RNase P/RNase MRP subunit POP5
MSKRYILVKVISKHGLSAEQFGSALTDSVRRYFGELGLARVCPKVNRFETSKSEAVIGCSKEGAEDLLAAIGLISDTHETTLTAITMRVSGTIKGLRRRQRF